MKNIISLLAVAILVFLSTKAWYDNRSIVSQEEGMVLIEKIKTVNKLVNVEGYFSEVYDYKDYWKYDISPFQKKALIRIKAKVLIGYDLEAVKIEADEKNRTISMSRLGSPKIISMEHDLDYYDITQGSFNAFTVDDYNKMEENAKQMIVDKVMESDLFTSAEKQGQQTMSMVKLMTESMGWTVKWTNRVGKNNKELSR